MTSIGAQYQGAIWFDLLPARPCDGVAHVLYFNFSLQFEALPLDSLWQHELRLANFSGQWIAGIETTAGKRIPAVVQNRYSQYAGDTRDPVISKTND